MSVVIRLVVFFFSSRRRHTRCSRDWSSDVCSSDLLAAAVEDGNRQLVVDLDQVNFIDSSGLGALISGLKSARQAGGDLRIANPSEQRSEERRVGKECRSPWRA